MGAAAAVSRAFGGAADGRDRGRPRHDLPRQHVPGVQQRLQRAVRAARRRRAVGRARARPSSTTSAAARTAGPRRWRAACCRSRSVGLGCRDGARHRVRARSSRELLTDRRRRPVDRRGAAGAHHLPAAVLHPAGAALRPRRGRHRRAPRPGPVRARRHRTDRQHDRPRDRHARCSARWPDPDPGLDLVIERAAGPRPRRHARASPRSSACPPSGSAAPGSASASAPRRPWTRPGRPVAAPPLRAGPRSSTPAPASCSPPR